MGDTFNQHHSGSGHNIVNIGRQPFRLTDSVLAEMGALHFTTPSSIASDCANDFSLKEFALGMLGPDGDRAIVAMIFGYFDESGTDLLHPHTALGGFIGPIDDWLATMRDWKVELSSAGVSPFHRVECKGRNGPYRGWTAEQSAKHIDALAEIAATSPLHTVSASFNGDWSKVATTPELRLRYPHPYNMCFELLIENIVAQAERRYGAGNQIIVVMEEQNQFSTRALDIYNIFKFNGRWPEISHFSYGRKENVPYLQLADLFVWEIRRYFWADANAKKQNKDYPLIRRLIGRDDFQHGDLGTHHHAIPAIDLGSVIYAPVRFRMAATAHACRRAS